MSEHDDLGEWAEDALVRALRAPGSPEELAREPEYAAAYREAVGAIPAPIPLPRRAIRRLGAGGTAVVVAIALSGGAAAAAYTGSLPDPVQELAHTVIGAPAPEGPDTEQRPDAAPSRKDSPEGPSPDDPASPSTPTASAAPSAEPSAAPSSAPGPSSPGGPGGPGGPSRDPEPSTTPSDEPSAAPSTPPPPPAPATSATISAAAHAVAYGGTVALSGQLTTAAGDPAAGVRVKLQVKRAAGGWAPVTRTVTDQAGFVSAGSLPVTGLARYRWRSAGIHSRPWRLRIDATMAASADVGAEQTTIVGTAGGASPGDAVVLVTLVRRQPVVVGRGQVGGDGTVSFTFRTPAKKRVFSVRLSPTRDHTPARARVVVVSPRPPAPEPSPSPSPSG